jgi:hypothetical protein
MCRLCQLRLTRMHHLCQELLALVRGGEFLLQHIDEPL